MKSLLFKPFEKYSEKTLLIAGISFTIIASLLAYVTNSRFDGVLDLHFVSNVLLQQPLIDNLINIFSLTLFLYAAAKFVNKKTRIVDILTTSIVARTPYYLLPLFNINNTITNASEELLKLTNPELINQISGFSLFIITVFGLLTLLFMVWYIALLFNGFKVASHAKGAVPIILFVVALILAEILSKYLLAYLS